MKCSAFTQSRPQHMRWEGQFPSPSSALRQFLENSEAPNVVRLGWSQSGSGQKKMILFSIITYIPIQCFIIHSVIIFVYYFCKQTLHYYVLLLFYMCSQFRLCCYLYIPFCVLSTLWPQDVGCSFTVPIHFILNNGSRCCTA